MSKINAVAKQSVSLADFCEFVEANPERLQAISEWPELWAKFYALYLNRNLLTDFFNEGLLDTSKFQFGNNYSGQSFLIVKKPGYYIRANVWPPAVYRGEAVAEEQFNRFYVYGDRYAHDHNFDFLTIGYYGPGYVTDLYTYDHRSVRGDVGEAVDLLSEGRHVLSEGSMLLFEKSKDVHVQFPPDQLTISLNFIPDLIPTRRQVMFDVEKKRVVKTEFPSSRRVHMDVLVDLLGSKETKSVYKNIVAD
ncbi:hypothetical protein [Luteimonas sp. gir]|uniref:hypothetical protein n=1 Tax=Luteimonas sp. gir TaxID=3127960 RepID=UPI003075BCD1